MRVTHDPGAGRLSEVRALLEAAFPDDFTEEDWEHALGGTHALVLEDGAVVGHGSVVARTLRHGGRSLRTGYVEGLAVRADRRGRGHGAALMDALEGVIRAGFELGALSTTEMARGFYEARGWVRWRGPTRPPDDGSVYVLPVSAELDPGGELTADPRPGDVW